MQVKNGSLDCKEATRTGHLQLLHLFRTGDSRGIKDSETSKRGKKWHCHRHTYRLEPVKIHLFRVQEYIFHSSERNEMTLFSPKEV